MALHRSGNCRFDKFTIVNRLIADAGNIEISSFFTKRPNKTTWIVQPSPNILLQQLHVSEQTFNLSWPKCKP